MVRLGYDPKNGLQTPNTVHSVVHSTMYLVSQGILCHCGNFSNESSQVLSSHSILVHPNSKFYWRSGWVVAGTEEIMGGGLHRLNPTVEKAQATWPHQKSEVAFIAHRLLLDKDWYILHPYIFVVNYCHRRLKFRPKSTPGATIIATSWKPSHSNGFPLQRVTKNVRLIFSVNWVVLWSTLSKTKRMGLWTDPRSCSSVGAETGAAGMGK